MNGIRIGVAALALGLPAAAQAQETEVKLSGHVRVRYEALDGQPRAGLNAEDEQLAVRSVVLLEVDPAGPFNLGVQLQDSRAYLGKPGSAISNNDVDALEINQAYVGVDLGAALGKGSRTRLQAGRFLTNIGSRRLVAGDEYRNASNSFTGIRADVTSPALNATLFYLLPQTRLPDTLGGVLDNGVEVDRESFDAQIWGALLAKPRLFAGATAEIGYVGFVERDAPGRPTRDRSLHSIDVRAIRDPAAGKWDFEAEAIHQFGTTRTGTAAAAPELDVSAWFLHGEIGYTFASGWKPRVALEYDYASGDAPGGRYGRFDTLFGMRRMDLGPAGIYAAIGRANISTPGIRFEAAPDPRWDVMATYKALWLAEKTDAFSNTGVRDASGASGGFAGHQLDARLRVWLIPRLLRAEANGVVLLKRGVLDRAPNAPATGDTHYGSIALTISY